MWTKEQHNEYMKKWRLKHPQYVKYSREQSKKWNQKHRGHRKEYDKEWRQKHKEYVKEYLKKWRQKHREHKKEYAKKWYQENEEHVKQLRRDHKKDRNKQFQERYKVDIFFKLNRQMSHAVYKSLRAKKNNRHWETLVGYTRQDLMKHLEKQFTKKMNWGNHGKYWHIDHVLPISHFKFSSYNDIKFKKCWCLSNLQPLEKHENLIKNRNIQGQIPLLFY